MRTTEKGLGVIRSFEGRALRAYQDEVGVWTVGYGLTNMDAGLPWRIQRGLTITDAEAEQWLRVSLERRYEPSVAAHMDGRAPADPPSFDAGTSFHFNTGAIARAGWVKLFAAGDRGPSMLSALMSWNRAGGRVLAGLTRRRAREGAMIQRGDYGPEGRTGPATLDASGRPVHTTSEADRPDTSPTVQHPSRTPGLMRLGATGDEVMDLQRDLARLGFLDEKKDVTGSFGSVTEAAVRRYQEAHPDLTADGVAGPATRASLARDIALRAKALDAAKKVTVAGGPLAGVLGWVAGLSAAAKVAIVAGVLLLAVAAYLAWRYRTELARTLNSLTGTKVP